MRNQGSTGRNQIKVVPEDRTLRKIHYAVGKALSSWEMVELTMARLFGVLVESQSVAALRSYGSIISARGRRQALEAAGTVYFWKNNLEHFLDDFITICGHYEGASWRRNNIAHGVAGIVIDPAGIILGCFLIPPPYVSKDSAGSLTKLDEIQINISEFRKRTNIDGTKVPYDYAFNANIISAFDKKFNKLRGAIIAFTKRIDKDVAREMKDDEFMYKLPISETGPVLKARHRKKSPKHKFTTSPS